MEKSKVSVKYYRIAGYAEETIKPGKRNAGKKYLSLFLKPRKRTLASAKDQEKHVQLLFDEEDINSFFEEYIPLTKKDPATFTAIEKELYAEFSGMFYDIPGKIVNVEGLPPFQLQQRDEKGEFVDKWTGVKTSLQVFMLFDIMEDGTFVMKGNPLEEVS